MADSVGHALPGSPANAFLSPIRSQALYFGGSGLQALEGGHFNTDDDDHHRRQLYGAGGGLLAPVFFCVGTVGLGWAFAWAMLHVIIMFSRQILQVRCRASAGGVSFALCVAHQALQKLRMSI